MYPLRRGPGLLQMALGLLGLASILLLPTVHAQPCPSVEVSAYARPRKARKPGQPFAIYAKVRNTGATPMYNMSVSMTVPLSATYPRAKPVIIVPNAFWPIVTLLPGKSRVFKLVGKMAKCAQSGDFDVDVAVYMVDTCSTPADPVKVRPRRLLGSCYRSWAGLLT